MNPECDGVCYDIKKLVDEKDIKNINSKLKPIIKLLQKAESYKKNNENLKNAVIILNTIATSKAGISDALLLVRELIVQGEDCYAMDNTGKTPLEYISDKKIQRTIIGYILDYCVSKQFKNPKNIAEGGYGLIFTIEDAGCGIVKVIMDNSSSAKKNCDAEFNIYKQMESEGIGPNVCKSGELCHNFYYLTMEKYTSDGIGYINKVFDSHLNDSDVTNRISTMYSKTFDLIDKMFESIHTENQVITFDVKFDNVLVNYDKNNVIIQIVLTDFSPSWCIKLEDFKDKQIEVTKIMLKLQLYIVNRKYIHQYVGNIIPVIMKQYTDLLFDTFKDDFDAFDYFLEKITNGKKSLRQGFDFYLRQNRISSTNVTERYMKVIIEYMDKYPKLFDETFRVSFGRTGVHRNATLTVSKPPSVSKQTTSVSYYEQIKKILKDKLPDKLPEVPRGTKIPQSPSEEEEYDISKNGKIKPVFTWDLLFRNKIKFGRRSNRKQRKRRSNRRQKKRRSNRRQKKSSS